MRILLFAAATCFACSSATSIDEGDTSAAVERTAEPLTLRTKAGYGVDEYDRVSCPILNRAIFTGIAEASCVGSRMADGSLVLVPNEYWEVVRENGEPARLKFDHFVVLDEPGAPKAYVAAVLTPTDTSVPYAETRAAAP